LPVRHAARIVEAPKRFTAETHMVTMFLLIGLLNLVGAVVCHTVARTRGSKKVVFWTTMGVLFGPLAIPFALHATRAANSSESAHA
jgi:hypothetical protein